MAAAVPPTNATPPMTGATYCKQILGMLFFIVSRL
jgi:hypothetical protein